MKTWIVGSMIFLTTAASFGQAVKVDPAIGKYEKTSGVSGNLNSIGSDTLNNLMTLWAEAFRTRYPNVKIQIEGKGSSTAPPALIGGTAQIGPMSRLMKPTEVDDFEKAFGYKPTPVRVAIDALAVYVNKDNPIEKLTLAQVDAIFSKTRKCGAPAEIRTWGELGLGGGFADRPISIYGRNSASGTYGYFKKKALCKGDYKDTVKEQPGSASVVQGVAEDLYGIGYSGIGYRTSAVKTVALSKKGGKFYGTGTQDVLSGKYPLSRFLYLYINKAPNRPVDPLVREFIRFVLSREGQQIVVKDGYLPLNHKLVTTERKLVD
ncbi:MAG: phosphate ABC transporter substrate-binding protein [Acidobacteriota bacterium]|nr:phosphate ABC transporter substrate-binding protein [Acidobacteriota bacterium]MDQ7087882.1 phosphate ABC transporter substrate-binding protein [Acidobacteriota bacterium]